MIRRPIFTAAHIAAWNAELDKRLPMPTEAEWPDFPQVDAFTGGALTAGVSVRFRTAGNEPLELRMNPVLAREFANWLFHAGRQAGWLDERYNVISPLVELDG